MTKPIRATLIPIFASFALAACGGNDGPATQQGPRPAPSTDASTESTSPAADDKAAIRKALLVLTDLPTGWTGSDDEDESDPSDCAAIRSARSAASARDSSRDFAHQPTGQVSHSVYLYSDEQRAASAYRDLVTQESRTCLGSQLRDRLSRETVQKDVKVGDVETSELAIDPAGEQSSASRVSLDYSTSGLDLTLATDLVYIREGRGISFLVLVDETATFDEQLRARLASVVARKLRNAVAQ